MCSQLQPLESQEEKCWADTTEVETRELGAGNLKRPGKSNICNVGELIRNYIYIIIYIWLDIDLQTYIYIYCLSLIVFWVLGWIALGYHTRRLNYGEF